MAEEAIILSNVRLSFPHLAEPQRQVNASTGKERISYNCEFIMPQDHPGMKKFMQRYATLSMEKWKEHSQNVMNMIQNDRKQRCYGRGEEKVNKKTFQPYDGYAGNVFITAGSDVPPKMVKADGAQVDFGNSMIYMDLARRLYGGCRVNAAIKPWLQDNSHGRAIRCDLLAVQFYSDDVAFGEGRLDTSEMFSAIDNSDASIPPLPPFMR